jgi:hypothetical protein
MSTGNSEMFKKNPGSFSIDGNKLRVTNRAGLSSVLFEDISSISFKSLSIPNFIFIILGIILGFMMVMNQASGLGMLIILLGGILAFVYPNKWENVLIETRGGMLISYSVEVGEGIKQVNLIEDQKRKINGIGI